MPLLVYAKRRTGRELGSATVVADSTQTLLCTYLSAILLAGLALNAWLGWAWADPVAGLVIAAVAVAVREGVEAWRGEQCCDCAIPAASGPDTEADGCGCGPGCTDASCTGKGGSRRDHRAALVVLPAFGGSRLTAGLCR